MTSKVIAAVLDTCGRAPFILDFNANRLKDRNNLKKRVYISAGSCNQIFAVIHYLYSSRTTTFTDRESNDKYFH